MRALWLGTLLALAGCGGSETLVGRDVSSWLPAPLEGAHPSARATLVRFFTQPCAHCEASLPTLAALGARYEGLATLAVYHPKPPRPATAEEARAAAALLGYHGPLALDPEWEALQGLRPAAGRSAPTSYCLLVDAEGRVRWFDRGPRLHPSAAGEWPAAQRAYEGVVAAIEGLLGE